MQQDSVITVSGIRVTYDRNVILDDVSLEVKTGEILGLLGPSGSGKTTLVKAIIGMKEPVEGEIRVLGEKMPSLRIIDRLGYMAQSDALYEDLSGLDNLLFFGALYGMKGKTARQRGMDVLALVSLEQDFKKLVKNYSGGMKRRLSLAIAFMHNPKLLILDEPTIGIDPLLRRSFWDEFYRIRDNGGSLIVTTHVMDEAHRCDRLALIRNGRIIANDTPDGIVQSSKTGGIEEAFLYYSDAKGDARS